MAALITYQQCPCCGSKQIASVLSVKDYTVSKEMFDIWHCQTCTLRFTQQIPDSEGIGAYYKAESYVSHTDSQKGLINKTYHAVRKITLGLKYKFILKTTGKTTGVLLDVGAGTGAFVNTMHQGGWQVKGLEPDTEARSVAQNKYGIILDEPTELFKLMPNQFDAITMWHVLEHVHDLHAYLKQFFSLLKQDGKLVIAVPNYTSGDANRYQEYWAAYDVPRHLYHFSPKSMAYLAQLHGFSVAEYKPMWFDSFYVSMLSEQYKTGQPNLFKACVAGLVSNLKAVNDSKVCSSVIYILTKQ